MGNIYIVYVIIMVI